MSEKTAVEKVMEQHIESMLTMDPKTIAADYAEDAVIIMSAMDEPIVGRDTLEKYLESFLPNALKQLAEEHPNLSENAMNDFYSNVTFKKIIEGDYGMLIFDEPTLGMRGVETYVVKDGKIALESVDAQGSDILG
uniref:nuclear transport factor 2 family protein n=1 Tax=Tetragenococcus halophilus TaxID=51669 RepID=UPI0024E133FA|nr:nuclear transport factor 2 family protein [Tetragenococcus halophilus]